MRRPLLAILVVLASAVVLPACKSENKLGEACEEPGKTKDECADGTVCTHDTTGGLLCLKICTEQAQCATGEDCNGTDNAAVKACVPKTGSSGTKK